MLKVCSYMFKCNTKECIWRDEERRRKKVSYAMGTNEIRRVVERGILKSGMFFQVIEQIVNYWCNVIFIK